MAAVIYQYSQQPKKLAGRKTYSKFKLKYITTNEG